MPKISDEKRAARRAQILEAAWVCFRRNGLHAATMGDIIRASGLSSGAVYSYYSSKDELILAAVTASLSGIRDLIIPVARREPALSPTEMVRQIAETVDQFTARKGYDLKRLALLGWSEAQHNEILHERMRGFYLGFRAELADAMRRWDEATGEAAASFEAKAAKRQLSLVLGYVVQAAILGDVTPDDLAVDPMERQCHNAECAR